MREPLNYYEIGQRIRSQRKKRGLTQEAAAELCDITVSFLGNIERGDKKMSLETFAKIADRFSVSTDYLLFGGELNAEDQGLALIQNLQKNKNPEQYQKYLEIMQAVSTIINKL